MRILFISHYFYPEGNAPATRVYELTRRWVEAGHQVTVITGAPNVPGGVVYDGYQNKLYQRQTVAGVDLRRVGTYLAANKGTVLRIANYLSFMVTATLAGLFVPKPDVVIATSPQFFCGFAGVLVSKLRRRPFVLEIRDIWPESIAAVGAMNKGLLIRFLEFLELRMYAAANRVVTVGEGYRGELLERGVEARRIDIIPNGVDLDVFVDGGGGAALREEFDLGDRFVCSYVGTIGMGSALDVVLRAARKLAAEGDDSIRFVLIGDGAVREELEGQARREGLRQVVFTGRQPKSRMPDFLAMTDACLVHLGRKDLFRTVLPSKIFEASAMRKPIVLGVEGSAAELVDDAGAGLCIEPENEDQLLAAVRRLAEDEALCAGMGKAGYDNIATRYDYAELARRYETLLLPIARA